VRLSDLDTEIGPLPPPSTWAENLCTMQGVNYEALRTRTESEAPDGTGGTGGGASDGDSEVDLVAGFADQYMATTLPNLANSWSSTTSPTRSTRRTICSSVLKTDLLNPISECAGEARNLLFQSDRWI